MRTNKINSIDLFTSQANLNYQKHVKTQSMRTLEILKDIINWDELLIPIKIAITSERSSEPAGRKRFDLLVIVRCFLLQSIYNLSDSKLEEEIADRRSFQIFLDLYSGDSIPDETTICRYRDLFSKDGLDKLLFDTFNKQLQARNMLLKRVTLVDATIKQAQANPGKKREPDASFTKKRNKTFFGFKGHIGTDLGTGVIHSVEFTPANVHDSNKFDDVVTGNEQSVYADKGYASKKRKKELEDKGIFCGIHEKGYRNHPLSREQIAKNKQKSKIRNNVERPFSFMKKVLGYDRCKYYGLAHNRFQFIICAFTYNIRRLLTLSTATS